MEIADLIGLVKRSLPLVVWRNVVEEETDGLRTMVSESQC